MSDFHSIKNTIQFFWDAQRKYPKLLFGMLAIHPLAILFFRFLPALIVADILHRLSTHDFVKGDLLGSFGWDLLVTILLEALGGIVLWRLVIYFNWKLEGYAQRDISRTIFNHLMRLSSSFHSNTFSGSLVSQTSKLLGAYVRFTDVTLFQVIGLFWALLFSSLLLIGRAPLYVLMLVVLTFVYMFIAVVVTGKVRKLNKIEANASNAQTAQLADAVSNIMAVKSFAGGAAETKRYNQFSEKTRVAANNLMRATLKQESLFGAVGSFINGLSLIISVASIVIYEADIATVFLIINFTSDVLVRLWEFSTHALRNYNRAFGDAQAMIDNLAIQPTVKDPSKPEKIKINAGRIQFKDVVFGHASSKHKPLFNKLNIDIQPSEKIGLVGHSGSGKTTLTRLLLRFSDIQAGQIIIDGQDISTVRQDDLRERIAYVPQEPLLFHRSIRENIAYGRPAASDEEIIEAAKKAHALEFIDKLADGLDTLVGERGIKLSGGQRQRIAIARALIKNAPILVLDEATSALDSESEKLIQSALWELMKGRTTIVIAHRLSTIQKMDRIIVLDDGSIVEEGSHDQLIKLRGTYASLWAHQSGGFLEEN